jgi:hypothetical protein
MPKSVSRALAKKALEPVGGLIQRIAGLLADEIGDSLAIIARPYRIQLSLKMLQKTKRMLEEAGITPQGLRSVLEDGVPTVRNKMGGHGQGPQVVDVSSHYAAYALHMTGSAIQFLIDAERDLP